MHASNPIRGLAAAGFLLVLAAGLAVPAHAETPEFDAALKGAAEAGRPLILDFYTDW